MIYKVKQYARRVSIKKVGIILNFHCFLYCSERLLDLFSYKIRKPKEKYMRGIFAFI